MLLHLQVLEEMEKEDSSKERDALDGEQASADVATAMVESPLDISSSSALDASAEDESVLQSTDPDRDMAQVSAASEVRVSFPLSC